MSLGDLLTTIMFDITIILTFLVGLVIFMHGIESFSHEILRATGDRFRQAFRLATKNRWIGALSGMLVTSFIQSSTATTIITISLVSAGAISFAQSLGIIVGANIGTTITAQLVAFKITSYSSIFIVAGFLVSLSKKMRYIGKGIFYFGLVFFGLNLISEAILPIKDSEFVLHIFSNLSNPLIALLAGLIFTALVHSSSITTGLVVVLSAGGIINLEQSIPILLGVNIGTTISALYSSFRLNKFAKRAAVAHTIFNVGGVLILLPLIQPFIRLIYFIGGSEAQQIANAHTIFNILIAIIFLIFLKPYQKLIERLVKVDEEEILLRTKYLSNTLPPSNAQSFLLIEKETSHFLHIVFHFYEKTILFMRNPSDREKGTIEKYEILSDLLDEKIESALLSLSRRPLDHTEAQKIVLLVRISNLVEQLADSAKSLSVIPDSMSGSTLLLSMESMSDIEKIYERMRGSFDDLQKQFPNKLNRTALLKKRLTTVQQLITKGYSEHIKRLKSDQAYAGSIFVESSSLLENGASKLKEIIVLVDRYAKLK